MNFVEMRFYDRIACKWLCNHNNRIEYNDSMMVGCLIWWMSWCG